MTFIAGVPTPFSVYGEIEDDFFEITVGTNGPFATELPWTIGLEIESLEHPNSAVHLVTEFFQNEKARWTVVRNVDGAELMTFEDIDGGIRNQNEQFIYRFRASQVPLPNGALRIRAWTLPVAAPEPQKTFTRWESVYAS